MGLFSKPAAGIRIGGNFAGISTRADGRTRANFINNPATGRDRAAVRVVKKAAGRKQR